MASEPKSIEEQRLELERTRAEREAKHFSFMEMNEKHSWKGTLLVGLFIAIVSVAVQQILGDVSADAGENIELEAVVNAHEQKGVDENRKLLSILDGQDANLQNEQLCKLYNSKIFSHEDSINKLLSLVEQGKLCKELKIKSTLEEGKKRKIAECLELAVEKTSNCRAYDKSGFNDKPKASCDISLNAGEGYYFGQDRVEVVSESYRKLTGPRVIDAMKPKLGENKDYITSFSGRISCTNSRGTGRTCEARATVKAKSFPLSCLNVMSQG